MRSNTLPSLSSTYTVPSASASALWNEVSPGSSVSAASSFHWLLAYAHTQYGVSSVVPPSTGLPMAAVP